MIGIPNKMQCGKCDLIDSVDAFFKNSNQRIEQDKQNEKIVERLKTRITELEKYTTKGMMTPLNDRINELQSILGDKK